MFRKLAGAGIISQIVIIALLAIVYFLTPQVVPAAIADPQPSAPLGQWIYSLIQQFPSVARPLMIGVIVLIALLFNAILIRHDISPRHSVFTAIIALMLMLFTPDPSHLLITLFCLLLLLFSLHNVMDLYGEQYPFNKVLNATMSISVASMISPPAIVFAFFVWLGFFNFRVNSWREWAISLLGLILPYFYLALIYLWNNNLIFAYHLYGDLVRNFNFVIAGQGIPEYIAIGLTGFWGIISAPRFYQDASDKVISIRKKMWVIGQFAFAGLFAALLSGGAFVAMLPVVFIPFSAMIAYSIANEKRTWIHDLMALLVLIVALLNRFNF